MKNLWHTHAARQKTAHLRSYIQNMSVASWDLRRGKDKMFSLPSNKLFNNASSKKSHESGSSFGESLEHWNRNPRNMPENESKITIAHNENRKNGPSY